MKRTITALFLAFGLIACGAEADTSAPELADRAVEDDDNETTRPTPAPTTTTTTTTAPPTTTTTTDPMLEWGAANLANVEAVGAELAYIGDVAALADPFLLETACLDALDNLLFLEDAMLPTPDPALTDALGRAMAHFTAGAALCADGAGEMIDGDPAFGIALVEQATVAFQDGSVALEQATAIVSS